MNSSTALNSPVRRSGWQRRRLSLAASLPLIVFASACSSSDDGAASSSVEPAATSADAPVATEPTAVDPIESVPEDAPAESDSAASPDSSAPTTEPPGPAVTAPAGQTSIVVESTPDEYFVLYVRPAADSDAEYPVAVVAGEEGSTLVTDGRAQLPGDQYRVETMSVDAPGDVDGDGIDDLTEVADPAGSNPVNGAPTMDIETGAVRIPDRATFETLSYQGADVARDSYLADLEYVKFWIVDTDTESPKVYFMNTNNYNAHPPFGEMVGISEGRGGRGPQPGKMRGDIVFTPDATAPDGSMGRYRFAFQPSDAYTYAEIAVAFEALINAAPELGTKLFYYPFPESALPLYESEKALYEAGRVPVLVE